MGLNSLFKELIALNNLKGKGYSLVEITGNDGEVVVYIKRIEDKKRIEISGNSFIINKTKQLSKGGMPLYRFSINKSVAYDKSGKIKQTVMDSDILTEIIRSARLVGQNTAQTDNKKELIMLGLGAIIGGALGFIIAGAF